MSSVVRSAARQPPLRAERVTMVMSRPRSDVDSARDAEEGDPLRLIVTKTLLTIAAGLASRPACPAKRIPCGTAARRLGRWA